MRLEIITVEDLSAYVDGEVDTRTAESVANAMETDDRAAEVIAAFRHQNAELQRLHSSAIAEPVPSRLTALLARHRAALTKGEDPCES